MINMKIEYIQKCKCGAVTISFDNGVSNSMFLETFEKLNLDTGDATWLQQSCCCDHCVNHWGIDLCECGSGQKVGECIAIVHNPALIYKLSKLDCVNFIEMTEGYLNKTCIFVSN